MSEEYIKVSEMLDVCKKAADINRNLAIKCISSTGRGESDISSLGGSAYFYEQARIYEYDIPNIVASLEKIKL